MSCFWFVVMCGYDSIMVHCQILLANVFELFVGVGVGVGVGVLHQHTRGRVYRRIQMCNQPETIVRVVFE